MKLMIASDLHGSARYSELLLHRFRQEGAEGLERKSTRLILALPW